MILFSIYLFYYQNLLYEQLMEIMILFYIMFIMLMINYLYYFIYTLPIYNWIFTRLEIYSYSFFLKLFYADDDENLLKNPLKNPYFLRT